MKKAITFLAVLSFTCAAAFAQDIPPPNVSATATQTQQQQQQAQSAATNQGNTQAITFTSPPVTSNTITYDGTYTIKNVPSVSGPPLTTSNDTCMGSSSGGVNGPGFGVSIGSTWTDTNCKMLKNSRELWNMGMKAASMALLCTDPGNRAAIEMTGTICPQSMTNDQRKAVYGANARMDSQYPGATVAEVQPSVPGTVSTQGSLGPNPANQLIAYQQAGGNDPIVIKHLGGFASK